MVIGRLGRALRGGKLASRALTFADQAISSASNMLLSVSIATNVSASAFGEFAIIYSIYWLLLGGTRAAVLDPLLITQRNVLKDAPVHLLAAVSAAAVGAVGIPVGLALLATPLDPAWVVFFLGLPVLLLQDALRYVGFFQQKPGRAVLLDGVWLVVMVVATVLAVNGTIEGTAPVLALWVLGALLADVIGLVAFRIRRERLELRARLRAIWPVSGPLLGDFALSTGSGQLTVFVLPLVASTALLGSLKAAQVANGPLNITVAAATVICLPIVAGAVDTGGDRAKALRIGRYASLALAGVAVVYGGALALLPESVGRALFGQSWGSGWLVAAVSVQMVLFGITHGALMAMRGSRKTGAALRVRLAVAPVAVFLPIVLTAVWGRNGLMAGLVISAAAMSLASWLVAVRVVPQPPAPDGEEPRDLPADAPTGKNPLGSPASAAQ
jgi:O-antigen/teichoic acid export membrane protein